jgi:hypothetical protein
MNERPTQTPASSAPVSLASGVPTPSASTEIALDGLHIDERRGGDPARHAAASDPSLGGGDSLASRAARFRSGAPFLVERATLFDPDPLDPLAVPADRRPHSPHAMLPAALTLLVVVIVVGLAAGILFVRNADGPRQESGTGRLEQFSERVVLPPTGKAPPPDAPPPRDQVSYDLTRRSNDTIVGAWRSPKDAERQPADEVRPVNKAQREEVAKPVEVVQPVEVAKPEPEEVANPVEVAKPAPPETVPEVAHEVVSAPTEAPPSGLRRLMPKRLTGWLAKRRAEQVAESAEPPRAPLDDPYVSRSTAEAESGRQQPAPGTAEHPGSNVVARVGRETDPKEPHKEETDLDEPPPVELSEAEQRQAVRDRRAARRARRAELRRRREARLFAKDVDRFHMRGKGDVPYGFVFSGPQGQRP